jgi:hypothetical protein
MCESALEMIRVDPLTLYLEIEQNRIEFVSQKPAPSIPSDTRLLAFAVKILRAKDPNNSAACEWQR